MKKIIFVLMFVTSTFYQCSVDFPGLQRTLDNGIAEFVVAASNLTSSIDAGNISLTEKLHELSVIGKELPEDIQKRLQELILNLNTLTSCSIDIARSSIKAEISNLISTLLDEDPKEAKAVPIICQSFPEVIDLRQNLSFIQIVGAALVAQNLQVKVTTTNGSIVVLPNTLLTGSRYKIFINVSSSGFRITDAHQIISIYEDDKILLSIPIYRGTQNCAGIMERFGLGSLTIVPTLQNIIIPHKGIRVTASAQLTFNSQSVYLSSRVSFIDEVTRKIIASKNEFKQVYRVTRSGYKIKTLSSAISSSISVLDFDTKPNPVLKPSTDLITSYLVSAYGQYPGSISANVTMSFSMPIVQLVPITCQ